MGAGYGFCDCATSGSGAEGSSGSRGFLRKPLTPCRANVVSAGAVAQLGERLLCKQEVVGSIPSGSTITIGKPMAIPKPTTRPLKPNSRARNVPTRHIRACVLSDIVKRRSFRANAGTKGQIDSVKLTEKVVGVSRTLQMFFVTPARGENRLASSRATYVGDA